MATLTHPELSVLAGRFALEAVGVDMSPEFEQALALDKGLREKVTTGGWQAGKSTKDAAEIYCRLPLLDMERKDAYRYWIILPSYQTPHKEMDYLAQWLGAMNKLDSSHFPVGQSCWLSAMGGRVIVETRTGMDPEGIAGEPCDGVLVVEAGQQPEIIRQQVQGRIITRRGWATYSGTLEDDEAKPRWAWYGELASQWLENPTSDHAAFALPSWANRTVFPDGERDPEIQRQREILGEHGFNRRIAARPSGVQYPVYPMFQTHGIYDRWGIPEPQTHWVTSLGAGGHDYGEGHGHWSTLVAVTVNDRDEAWVREARWIDGRDTRWVEANRREMSSKYQIPLSRWGFDPMQREAADAANAEVAKGDRLVRAGKVEGRAAARRLYFDLEGEGVQEVYKQAGRVHLVKQAVPGQGFKYVYHRSDDDLMAAVEDAIWVIDMAHIELPTSLGVGYGARQPQAFDWFSPPPKPRAVRGRVGA